MASFSSKYNKHLEEPNKPANSRLNNTSRNRQDDPNQRRQQSRGQQQNRGVQQQNRGRQQQQNRGRQQQQNRGEQQPQKQEVKQPSYKAVVSNVQSIKTITLNELEKQNVSLPEIYKHKPVNKINDINQLLILKEIKWGESC